MDYLFRESHQGLCMSVHGVKQYILPVNDHSYTHMYIMIHGEFDNGPDNGCEILNMTSVHYLGSRSIIRSTIQSPCIMLSNANYQISPILA